ncbi:MAG: c-type cytochrome [Phaeovulum sp.]|uniref:c-type cytochrome n=1 Tax=Phaeovulum sp. TaxID=2934796 RepID=UPI002733D83D|nr:cytochrome c [Phaeovulum sp.]MDP3861873.1 c-type cytochrome [Phaeovulum sp.]
MRMRNMGFALAGLALVGFSTAALAEVSQGSIARGGKLYDKWYKVIGVEAPTVSHPLYPATNEKYAADPAANWRCKECHGWDGLGAAGAYATGSHASGIKGIEGAAGGDPATVVELLRGDHLFGDKLSDQDLTDLANFVVYGQVDWSALVVDKKSTGDAANGQQVYETACVGCHGVDGKLPKDMPPLGSLTSNPWEVTHKVLNGQPGEAMPALRAIDHQVSADLVAYLATLPAQ